MFVEHEDSSLENEDSSALKVMIPVACGAQSKAGGGGARRRARKDSKNMVAQREAAAQAFIRKSKEYFASVDEFELECE